MDKVVQTSSQAEVYVGSSTLSTRSLLILHHRAAAHVNLFVVHGRYRIVSRVRLWPDLLNTGRSHPALLKNRLHQFVHDAPLMLILLHLLLAPIELLEEVLSHVYRLLAPLVTCSNQ